MESNLQQPLLVSVARRREGGLRHVHEQECARVYFIPFTFFFLLFIIFIRACFDVLGKPFVPHVE